MHTEENLCLEFMSIIVAQGLKIEIERRPRLN